MFLDSYLNVIHNSNHIGVDNERGLSSLLFIFRESHTLHSTPLAAMNAAEKQIKFIWLTIRKYGTESKQILYARTDLHYHSLTHESFSNKDVTLNGVSAVLHSSHFCKRDLRQNFSNMLSKSAFVWRWSVPNLISGLPTSSWTLFTDNSQFPPTSVCTQSVTILLGLWNGAFDLCLLAWNMFHINYRPSTQFQIPSIKIVVIFLNASQILR